MIYGAKFLTIYTERRLMTPEERSTGVFADGSATREGGHIWYVMNDGSTLTRAMDFDEWPKDWDKPKEAQ